MKRFVPAALALLTCGPTAPAERYGLHRLVEDIADHVGLSTTHVHHLFRRWCGLTPKAFLQAITLDDCKAYHG